MRRYEDFSVGDTYRSEIGRTVTETDNLLFTMLAMNTNELHFNEEAAKASEWRSATLRLRRPMPARDSADARPRQSTRIPPAQTPPAVCRRASVPGRA